MQIHGLSATVEDIAVTAYGTKGDHALRFPCGVTVVAQTVADAELIILRACQLKDAMLATQAQPDAGLCNQPTAGGPCQAAAGHRHEDVLVEAGQ